MITFLSMCCNAPISAVNWNPGDEFDKCIITCSNCLEYQEITINIFDEKINWIDTKNGIKNPLAIYLGQRGGLKGGAARATKLSPERRKEIAIKGANIRWNKYKNEKKS